MMIMQQTSQAIWRMTQLAVLLAVLVGCSRGMEETVGASAPSASTPQLQQQQQQYRNAQLGGVQLPAVKRAAYTSYRSEFKRLPVYQFGLGKRGFASNLEGYKRGHYNFGLGKRTRPNRYALGLGKRSSYDDLQAWNNYDEDADGDEAWGFENYYPQQQYPKRNKGRNYSFGMGKRDSDAREAPNKPSREFAFGLGKRMSNILEEQSLEQEQDNDDSLQIAA